MTKLGILSDTHGLLPEKVIEFLKPCTHIIHAGDIGSLDVMDKLSEICQVHAVYGNIDGTPIRSRYPEFEVIKIENTTILVIHIGGYPERYDKNSIPLIEKYKPNLFISGHSHILRVMYDKNRSLLHINPGATGKYGFHASITAVRLDINGIRFENLEVFDLKK